MKEVKLSPHDISAEEQIIGSLLINGDLYDEIKFLEPSDFYHEPLKIMFNACKTLRMRNEFINETTVRSELERIDKLEVCGGKATLPRYISQIGSPLDIASYARIVRSHSVSRQIISLGEKCAQVGYSSNPDIKFSIQSVYDMISEFKKNNMPIEGLVTPKESSNMMLELVGEYRKEPKRLSWGFRDLDSITSGIYPAELIIIGARPSVGKTQLMLDIMEYIANTGKNIMFCSAEMSLQHILERRIARELGMSILDLRKGNLKEEQENKIYSLIGENSERNIFYMRKGTSSEDIFTEASKLKDEIGLDIIFVDYLQFLSDCWQSNGENQNVRVGKASKTLKTIANELNIPVVVASQLNRALEHRGESDRRPTLADLRDSGNIEQDADVVFLLDRIQETVGEHIDNTRLSVKMAKNRQIGSMPAIELKYSLKARRYENCEISRRSSDLPKLYEEPVFEEEGII
jgi:replicative DNA helicase